MINQEKAKEILKKVGWFLLEALAFLGIALVIGLIIFGVLAAIGVFDDVSMENKVLNNPWEMLWSEFIPQAIALTSSLILVRKYIFKPYDIITGLEFPNALKDFGIGYLIAFLLVTIGFFILLFSGNLDIMNVSWSGILFFGFLLLFLVQSYVEELVFRSFLIPTLSKKFGAVVALIVSSLLFSALHGSNPGVSNLGLCNIALGGLVMGLLFIRYQNIWAPLGLHAGWNFVQSVIYDFEVSGFDTYSLLTVKELGGNVWTGGEFGYEGSLMALILQIAISIWMIYRYQAYLFPESLVDIASEDGYTPPSTTF